MCFPGPVFCKEWSGRNEKVLGMVADNFSHDYFRYYDDGGGGMKGKIKMLFSEDGPTDDSEDYALGILFDTDKMEQTENHVRACLTGGFMTLWFREAQKTEPLEELREMDFEEYKLDKRGQTYDIEYIRRTKPPIPFSAKKRRSEEGK